MALGSFETIAPLATAAQHLGSSFKAGQRLFEVIDTLPMIREPGSISPVPANYDLELRHLSFHYAYQGPDVLNDISFAIPQGHCVAVVGPSGAGKSTIASLLLRLWDYEQGSIQLGGYELRGYHQQDVHRLISVVEQNTHLFNATIRENLLIARPEASQAEIEEAARQASIHDVIEALPQGYDTLIGEQGLKLSGGERQRLAIARAIHHLIEGRTTLMITHRLVGLERADEILVMQSGRIRERGTQHELLQCEGLYWKLWQIQNQTVAAQG